MQYNMSLNAACVRWKDVAKTKVGEQHVLKQPNMSQDCVNFQFLHMRFFAQYMCHTYYKEKE